MKKKVALHNLGCKVNSYELEAMQQLLEQAGYEIVPFEPGADVYVINTCTVTNIADRKSRQMLHKAKKMNPDAVVVATGCYVQTDEGKLETDEAVDLVLGNNQKKNIVEVLAEFEKEHQRQAHIIKINQTKEYEELEISRTAEHVRAYIKVQDGCNQFCTYCIIPYARGRVRSREKENILNEVHKLAKAGYKEVVLTGIHLSSYGVDFPEDKKETLLSLIQAVNEVEGIQRIRLGSLEPGKAADLFMIDTAVLELTGALHDPKNIIARAGLTGPVWMTMINGNVVYRDGALTGVDEERLAAEGEALCSRVIREPSEALRNLI